jgi:multicomponent Na+:H+ antiporter subunit G
VEWAGLVFVSVGLLFDVAGCLGLVRLPDVYNRLQAATKCVTFGTCSILFGTVLLTGLGPIGVKALLALAFVALTAPVAAHAISRASHRAGIGLWKGSVCDRYAEDTRGFAARGPEPRGAEREVVR